MPGYIAVGMLESIPQLPPGAFGSPEPRKEKVHAGCRRHDDPPCLPESSVLVAWDIGSH